MSELTTPIESEVNYSEDSAAAELLKRWGADETPDAEPSEQPEAPEQSEEDDAPADGEAQEEESAESEQVEIDVAGEKFKLPPALAEEAKRIESKVKEIEAGATKKFQEAADLRKSAESQLKAAQELQTIALQQADLIADHKAITKRLQQLENVDVNALADQDPVQLTKLTAEWNQLNAAKQRVESKYQEAVAQSQQKKQTQQTERLGRLNEYAQKNIKGWSEEYSQNLLEFSVKQLGFDADMLRENMSESIIKALDLAYAGYKVRNADPKAKQVQQTKTLKPGASGQMTTNAQATRQKAESRLKQSGKVDDAVMALLARSNTRKR